MVRLINPAAHPVNGRARKKFGFAGPRERISTCKVCRFGVYNTDDWDFYRRPTGICHTRCVEGGDAQ